MIDNLLHNISATGWLINNLCQLDNGSWRCNLRQDERYTNFATAPTALEALASAFDLLETAEEFTQPAQSWSVDTRDAVAEFCKQMTKHTTITRRPK